MIIEINQEISELAVFAESFEQTSVLGLSQSSDAPVLVHTFKDPLLLTDSAEIGKLPSGLRDALFELYTHPRTVKYDDVAVSWSAQNYPQVWCPSIDTIFFARNLKKQLENVKSFAEIGTGSGFLTKFALHHGDIDRALASDISMHALRCADDNLRDLQRESVYSLVKPLIQDDELGFHGEFDLIFSNPPYIPRPGEKRDNPYEGLNLVHKLSQEASNLLSKNGKIMLNLSSLAEDAPLEWFQDFKVTQIDKMRVPLKVNPVSNGAFKESIEWLRYLTERGFIEEDKTEDSGYRWWHELRMFVIEK